jgi:hypothetical protein
MGFFFGRLFPWPFVLVGAGLLFFGGRALLRARESVAWPTTEGTVRKSTVEYHSGDKGGGTYHAEVFYNYSVDGVAVSGNRVAYGDYGSSDPSHAQGIVNRYPNGAKVTVYYMPGHPDESVLEPGLALQAWILPGMGLLFFIVGCAMVVFLPRLMARTAATAQSPPVGSATYPPVELPRPPV